MIDSTCPNGLKSKAYQGRAGHHRKSLNPDSWNLQQLLACSGKCVDKYAWTKQDCKATKFLAVYIYWTWLCYDVFE